MKKPTIANTGRRPQLLTRRTVKRIGRVVNAYERGDRDTPGVKFRRVAAPGGSDVRRCKTQGTFGFNSDGEVEVMGNIEGETLEATNKLARLNEGKTLFVAEGADDNKWYVIAAETEAVDVIVGVELTDDEIVFTRKRIWAIADDTELTDITIPVADCTEA